MSLMKALMRAGAIFWLLVVSLPFGSISSKAETAAEFFRIDHSVLGKPAIAAKPAARRTSMGKRFASDRRRSAGAGVNLRGSKAMFAAAARRHGVPVRMALAVVATESGGNCRAAGRGGALGPLQIKLRTARGLGFRGPASALRSCGAGLYWGMKHLAMSYRKCGSPVLHQKGLGGSCGRTSYSAKVMRLASRF